MRDGYFFLLPCTAENLLCVRWRTLFCWLSEEATLRAPLGGGQRRLFLIHSCMRAAEELEKLFFKNGVWNLEWRTKSVRLLIFDEVHWVARLVCRPKKSALAFSSPQLNLFYLYFQRSHSAERPIRDARWPATTMTTATFHLIASGARNCIFYHRVCLFYTNRDKIPARTQTTNFWPLLISANKLFTRLQTCAPCKEAIVTRLNQNV
jgi:hypothetical protein